MVIDRNVPFVKGSFVCFLKMRFVNVSLLPYEIGSCLPAMNESLFSYQTIIIFVYNSSYILAQLHNGALQQLASLKPSRMCVRKLDER